MKLAVLICLILAQLAATVHAQGGGDNPIVNWPTDFERNQAGLHMWDCNYNIEDQRAALVYYGSYGDDLLFRIGYRSDLAPLCLDAPEGHIARDVRIRLWECNYTAAQQFELSLNWKLYRGGFARYLLRSFTRPEHCLSVGNGPLFNGLPITLQSCLHHQGISSHNFWSFVGRDGRMYAPLWRERAGLEKLARTRGRLAPESIGGVGGITALLKNETSVAKLTRATGLKITSQNSTHVLWWERMPEEPKL